jgi:hypothetical protein
MLDKYIFVIDPPADDRLRPSLQLYENALILMAGGRSPAAVVMLGSAIESVLKLEAKGKFVKLLDRFQTRHATKLKNLGLMGIESVDGVDGKEGRWSWMNGDNNGWQDNRYHPFEYSFRDHRNTFTHTGFSPEDNAISDWLLAAVGFPFYQYALKSIAEYDLATRVRSCLAAHLGWVIDAVEKPGHPHPPANDPFVMEGLVTWIRDAQLRSLARNHDDRHVRK